MFEAAFNTNPTASLFLNLAFENPEVMFLTAFEEERCPICAKIQNSSSCQHYNLSHVLIVFIDLARTRR